MIFIKSIAIFILAGICEIGGGYLVWLWLKEGKPVWYGVIGGLILAFYGVVATWQTANFARVYAYLWWSLHRDVAAVGDEGGQLLARQI